MTSLADLKGGERARLIPVAADASKEVRATSILLACMCSVRSYREEMLASIGMKVGKRATLKAFTEVVLPKNSDGCRPDGLLVLETGRGNTWRALVEAKIGKTNLDPVQVERYLALARANGIDAVITVSNQFATVPTHSPVKVSKASAKGVALYHWSWIFTWTQARLLLDENEFEAPSERYILEEVERYMAHPSIGITRFDRMNQEWKDLVAKVQAGGVIARNDPCVEASVSAWHQESRDLCLLMTRELNRVVHAHIPKAHRDDPELRMKQDCEALIKSHKLHARLDVPDAAAPVEVVADLARRSLCIYMVLAAPKDKKKTSARINWLLRQLAKSKPENIYVRANWPGRAPATQAHLSALREDPSLIEGENKSLAPVSFEIMLVHDMAGRFSGQKVFIENLEKAVPGFYQNVGEHLRAYVPAPPKLEKRKKHEEETAAWPEAEQPVGGAFRETVALPDAGVASPGSQATITPADQSERDEVESDVTTE